jgi:hypothetical protein
MKVNVTQQDIERGRISINARCGCPIWHALVRVLGLATGKDLLIPHYGEAWLGARVRLPLTRRAQEWQKDGIRDPANLVPFSFNTKIKGA